MQTVLVTVHAVLQAMGLVLFMSIGSAAAQTASDAMLRRIDANGNGHLESGEIPSPYRLIIDRAARKAGLDPSKPISIEKLKQGLKPTSKKPDDRGAHGDRSDDDRRKSGPSDRDRGRYNKSRYDRSRYDRSRDDQTTRPPWGESNRSAKSEETVAGVPGFGVEETLPPVPGFDGKPLDHRTSMLPLEKQYDEKILAYVDQRILGRYDSNQDGYLDADEINQVPWGDDPSQDDINQDGRLDRADLAGRMARRWGYGRKRSENSSGRSPSSSRSFSSDSGARGVDDRYKRYASSLVTRYDTNKNGFLEKDEWKHMRGEPEKFDRNHDGRVTPTELAASLASYSSGNDSSRKSSSSSTRSSRDRERRSGWFSGRSRSSDESGERKTYRFSSPTERLPRELPSWFREKDTNGDGQVAMVEFSSAWNRSEVAQFKKNDLNNDGMITPRECITAKSLPSTPSSAASQSSDSKRRSSNPKRRSPDFRRSR